MYSMLYDTSIAPFPGYSIGPKDNGFPAGSFTCFIKHEDDVLGLINEHTIGEVSEKPLLPSSPYKYDGKGKKYIVTMPANKDHEQSLKEIHRRVNSNADGTPAKAYWEKVQKQGTTWNINVGHVIAMSGQDQMHQFNGYTGRLDWCIFECNTLKQDTEVS
ncbi:hypothetical protein DL98DRAFT_315565 [Cadophora sp. DSE1049]|nr:hypothetical protein DL98DRAFT_315565 [Cadophora sp. DSE1049]